MKTGFLLTGLVLLLIANLMMVYSDRGVTGEGFANYFLNNAGPSGLGSATYVPMGPFDHGVILNLMSPC